MFPLQRTPKVSQDDNHDYGEILRQGECIVPLPPHPGAYGVSRKHHIHEGIDLYGVVDEPVFTIQDGIIVDIVPFTGIHTDTPWWNDTQAVVIADNTGYWVYGELIPVAGRYVGQQICEGEIVGRLVPVLKKDKGRPTTMLHLERWVGAYPYRYMWRLNTDGIPWLKDPTPELLKQS